MKKAEVSGPKVIPLSPKHDEQINDFLYALLKNSKSPGKSYFRHIVYGLKCLFKMMGKQEKVLKMPPVSDHDTVPVVLSSQEVKALVSKTIYLKREKLY